MIKIYTWSNIYLFLNFYGQPLVWVKELFAKKTQLSGGDWNVAVKALMFIYSKAGKLNGRGCCARTISALPRGLQLDFCHGAAVPPPHSAPFATDASLSRGPGCRKELVVSQVLLILIGSGMTYCRGEGDCHGPTGIGAGGMQGWRRHLCVAH